MLTTITERIRMGMIFTKVTPKQQRDADRRVSSFSIAFLARHKGLIIQHSISGSELGAERIAPTNRRCQRRAELLGV